MPLDVAVSLVVDRPVEALVESDEDSRMDVTMAEYKLAINVVGRTILPEIVTQKA
jgi:hypothetical protein